MCGGLKAPHTPNKKTTMNKKKFIYVIGSLLALIFLSTLYLKTAFGEEFYEKEYAGRVSIEAEFLSEDIMKLTINAKEMAVSVLGIAFHLQYEKDKTAFLKYLPGEFLEKGGKPFYMVKDLREQNKIIFGETLKHNDSFPVGGGNIVEMYFQILDGEEWIFEFDRGVVSTAEAVRQDIDEILWENLWVSKNGTSQAFVGPNLKNLIGANTMQVGEKSFLSWLYILIAGLLLTAVATAIHINSKKTWAQ